MKSLNRWALICIISLMAISINHTAFAQQFPKVKVFLKNGTTFTGVNGNIVGESLILTSNYQSITYPLNEVQMIMTKKGWAGKWATGCGGGCAGLCVITIVAQPDDTEFDTGQLITSSMLWVAIFAASGYLIGTLTDHWETAYISPPSQSSISSPFQLGMRTDNDGGILVGLSYRF